MAAIVIRRSPECGVVVCIPDHVSLVAAVVFGLAQRVRGADLQAVAVTALRADLEAVVERSARILGDANGAIPLVRPQGRDVDTRIGLNGPRQELVDVAFTR